MIGTAGQAILLVSALAGLAIIGPLWLTFASHCFLTVLTESSIGDREVRWPDESIFDWWWKPLYCLGLLSFWAFAGGFFLWPLFLASPWAGAIGSALYLWFAYPIGLLCVMDAHNALAVFYVPLFVRLARHLPAVLLIGLFTLPLGVISGGLLALALRHSTVWAVPAAAVLPPALLLYARCWGRLAWLVLNVKGRPRRSAEDVAPPESARVTVQDPWAIPQEEPVPELDVEVDELVEPEPDDEWAERPAPYQLSAAAAPPTPAPVEGADGDGDPATPPTFSNVHYYEQYRQREVERRDRAEGRKPGQKRRRKATLANALGPDLWPFLAAHRTLRAGGSLGLATLALLLLLRFAMALLAGLLG